jgi:hypothetical protein
MAQDRIIVVAYHTGRIGSSAMMGLLKIAGVNVGDEKRLAGPAPMNPKGFFELWSQEALLRESYVGIYPGPSKPPSLDVLRETGKRHFRAYRTLLQEEFGPDFPVGVKSQRFLTLPFLHELRHEFDIRILVMTRGLEDQANSILRVWRNSSDPIK